MKQIDESIMALAARQHGTFHRHQAEAAGATPAMIRGRLGSGTWVNLAPGVHALAAAPATWRRDVMAAVLARPKALASGTTAGALHGISGCGEERPRITTPRSGNGRLGIAIVHRRLDYPGIARGTVDRIPVVTAAEALFDMCSLTTPGRVERAMDDALARSLTTAELLYRVLERIDGMRLAGTALFRDLLDGIDSGYVPPSSELERRLYRVLGSPLLPAHRRQVRLPWWERLPHRVDALIPDWRLIIEADGRTYHTKRADFENDRARDNLAAANGYRVMRFTWTMLADEGECLALLLTASPSRVRTGPYSV